MRCGLSMCFSAKGSGVADTKKRTTESEDVRRGFRNCRKALPMDRIFTNHESLPSLRDAFTRFAQVFPEYRETLDLDDIRGKEYYHLQQNDRVCMDYFGFGLFSHLQQQLDLASSSFNISYTSGNLISQALYGTPEEGSLESDMRNRILRFLNIMESEYTMVFTANRGSAFKLLAESYPFHINNHLLTVYDYESEGMNRMIDTSKEMGAKIMSALFKWPSLRICSSELRKLLEEKKNKEKKTASAKGLFVFPVQSRVTGTKYSYQWMSQAQQNGWHVLLDACALGPKDMDSLGFSFFRPDFIVCSFFKVFGEDPTGFGCLFVKRTSIHSLYASSVARGVGMVNIVPTKRMVSAVPAPDEVEADDNHYAEIRAERSSFSGPISVFDGQNHTEVMQRLEYTDTEPGWNPRLGDEGRLCSKAVDVFAEGHSSVQKIGALEGVDEEEERQRKCCVVSEHENSSSRYPFQECDAQEIVDGWHMGHKGGKLAAEQGWGKNWAYGETSRPPIRSPIADASLTKPTVGDIFEEDKEETATAKQLEEESMEKVSMNRKPQVYCKNLDHSDSLGLIRISNRWRYLINWLVNALLKLRHPSSENGLRLVKIYGPRVKFDRGAAVAFNLYDWKGELVESMLVQKLADRSNISLGYAFLRNIWLPEKYADKVSPLEIEPNDGATADGHGKEGGRVLSLTVVTAALGFLTNFEDVYRLWAFVAKFLDADFVEKERWRYRALNQQTFEV